MILLAEEVSDATFNRLNLYGVNVGRQITMPRFPYILKTSYLILAEYPPGTINKDASLTLQFEDLEQVRWELGDLGGANEKRGFLISWSHVNYVIPGEGILRMTYSCTGYSFTKEWEIINGNGSVRALSAPIPSTAVIDGRKNWDPLTHLKREVVKKILIADPYLTPEFLRRFLDSSTASWTVQVITSHQYFKEESPNATPLKESHPNLEIRFDDLFHDRLICRDDEEIFVFGASLKDLNRGRVSFFQRVYDRESTDNCISLLHESWSRAKSS